MSRPAVEIREIQPGDYEQLLADIRPADLAEAEALAGPGALPGLLKDTLAGSAMSWAMAAPDGVVCLFGVAPQNLMGDTGLPWMVGTTRVVRERRALMRLAPAYIQRMLAAFPTLVNVVDARNLRSISFLRHLGFTILAPVAVGAAGMPFHPFVKEA